MLAGIVLKRTQPRTDFPRSTSLSDLRERVCAVTDCSNLPPHATLIHYLQLLLLLANRRTGVWLPQMQELLEDRRAHARCIWLVLEAHSMNSLLPHAPTRSRLNTRSPTTWELRVRVSTEKEIVSFHCASENYVACPTSEAATMRCLPNAPAPQSVDQYSRLAAAC